ncbi:unnamed protein product [Caenorhabditis auriculariae]|uniref:BTB domain-containing protein n=1 Tax=Caenorhabditis auriculariae TaxID=2777116 RepID=A0A8S1HDZ6_9PELO|nr:unnamed protein product [Caenorhabditis auriculariae]
MRARSHSPRKPKPNSVMGSPKMKSKSKSPQKKHRAVINQLDYLNSQCHMEGCSVSIVVHSTRFLICRHQLCHASDYFKDLLQSKYGSEDFYVTVSSMSEPTPSTQFRWFVESSIPCPALKDISDETLETCMRLSRRFDAKGLEMRCTKFIVENACSRQPIVALCWLNWALKHKFDAQTQASCLPSVARLSLTALEQHRHMLTEKIFSDLLAAKLRGTYDKAVQVFRAIHRMDHFSVEVDRCPRCGRTRDGMRVKVNADPCRKQIGCDRCHRESCEIENKAGDDLQAFYQCPHGLVPLNSTTDECHCQIPNLAHHLGSRYYFRSENGTILNPPPLSPHTSRTFDPAEDTSERPGTSYKRQTSRDMDRREQRQSAVVVRLEMLVVSLQPEESVRRAEIVSFGSSVILSIAFFYIFTMLNAFTTTNIALLDKSSGCFEKKISKYYGQPKKLWERFSRAVSLCSPRLHSVELGAFANTDEFKVPLLAPSEDCVVLSLGIGKDVKAERRMRDRMSQCVFIGADPVNESNADLFSQVGKFYNVAVGHKNGSFRSYVLEDVYRYQEVAYMDLATFIKLNVNRKIVDQMMMDVEHAEYPVLPFLEKGGELSQRDIAINIEIHRPTSEDLQAFVGFLRRNSLSQQWIFINSEIHPFFKHIRLFMINGQNKECRRRFWEN